MIVAAVAMLLVATRTFTVIYEVALYGSLLLVAGLSRYRSPDEPARIAANNQIRNVIVSGLLVAVVIIPMLLDQFPYLYELYELYELYGTRHAFGEEKYIRAAELGLSVSAKTPR